MTVNILALGDSLTWGVSDNNVANGDQSGGYRTFLQASLEAAGFDNPTDIDFVGEKDNTDNGVSGPSSIDNDHQGQRGDRIEEINMDLSANNNVLLDTLDPDVVLLMAGTNNFLQDDTAETALNQLETLIETLVAASVQHILVASVPPLDITGTSGRLDADDETNRISFNNQLPDFLKDTDRFDAATIAKLIFVDVADVLDTSDISSDGVHLLSTGFSKVATAWHNALVPVLDPTLTADTIRQGTPQRLDAEDFNNLGDFIVAPQNNDGLPDNTQVIRLSDATGAGTATTTFGGETGYYDVTIGYFDENDAVGEIEVTIGDDVLDPLTLDQDFGLANISPLNYVHKSIGQRIEITQGDQISLTGTPGIGGNNELVAIDYLELIPVPAPSPSPNPNPTPSPNPNPTPSPNPNPTPSPNPNPTPSPNPNPTPSPNPNPTPSPNPNPTPSPNPNPAPSPNPNPDPSPEPTPSPNPSPDPTVQPTPAPNIGLETAGSKENDEFLGSTGNDLFKGKGGNDRAKGSSGDDFLIGGTGNDRLFGEDGNDRFKGGIGRDRLVGGKGDDELMGGKDIDTLQGDSGADIFLYTNKKDGGKKGDKIRDFDVLEDTLVFKGKAFDDALQRNRTLKKKFFTIGSRAKRANHRFIYNDRSGLLSFDPDGNGSAKAFKLARMDSGLDLDQNSISIT